MDAVILSAGHRYEVASDLVLRTLVFVRGAVTDDAGGRAVPLPFAVACDEPLLRLTSHDGAYALSGDTDVAFTDRTIPHPLSVEVAAEGYRPAAAAVVVPANPSFPVDAPIALRRQPVRVTGRVTALATGLPIAGARVTVAGPPLPAPDKAVLLDRPLAADLGAGAVVQGHIVTAVASPVAVKTVVAVARSGQDILLVDDRQGLAAGQLLRFGSAERAHWAEIAAVSATPVNPALPGLVTLTAKLALSVAAGARAAPFALGAASGPACAPSGNAYAGESLLIRDDAPSGDVVAIADPPAPVRYAGLGVLSDAAGDYAIDGLARLAAPVLEVAAAPFATQTRPAPLPTPPARGPTIIDWRLTP
jgi:hypothetical protein